MGRNLVFEVIWNPEPISVDEKIASNQSLIFELPLGVLVGNSGGGGEGGVVSVNNKTGVVVLNYLDVDADVFGSAAAVAAQLSIVEDSFNQELDALLVDLNNLTQEVGTKANAAAVTQALSTKADLIDGKVPASQLPEHVSDITEYPNSSFFPAVGESGRLYVDITTNISYRWSGTIYVPTGDGGVVLGTTAQTAHRGDHGVIAYNHAVSQGNPHNTSAAEVLVNNLNLVDKTAIQNGDSLNTVAGKLQAQINAIPAGAITWVDVSTLLGYQKNIRVTAANTKIEVAKINGLLHIRGYISTSDTINAATELMSFSDTNYLWDYLTNIGNFSYQQVLNKQYVYELADFKFKIEQSYSGTGSHRLKLIADQFFSSSVAKGIIPVTCIGKPLVN